MRLITATTPPAVRRVSASQLEIIEALRYALDMPGSDLDRECRRRFECDLIDLTHAQGAELQAYLRGLLRTGPRRVENPVDRTAAEFARESVTGVSPDDAADFSRRGRPFPSVVVPRRDIEVLRAFARALPYDDPTSARLFAENVVLFANLALGGPDEKA